MKQNLKTFFAELAGVDPSQIETSLDDEDFDMEGAPTFTVPGNLSSSRSYLSRTTGWRAQSSSARILII